MGLGKDPASDKLCCGDCHSPLPAGEDAEAVNTVEQQKEFYCPLCAAQARQPLACPHCGSSVCPRCGTPLELADDLGIG